jgi:RNA polymerase sigma-70 factor (ECF subfamily)
MSRMGRLGVLMAGAIDAKPMRKREYLRLGPVDESEPVALVNPTPDEDLVQRLVRGDAWAQEALYRRHFPSVFRTALRLLENRADAEDVVQDVFVMAYADIGSLRDPAAFGQWIVGITVHRAHRLFRRRKLLRAVGLDRSSDPVTLAELACEGVDPAVREALSLIDRELRRLPPRKRAAWVLRRIEGYSLEEVAAACACSVATAKRWIRAANERIVPHVDLEVSDES